MPKSVTTQTENAHGIGFVIFVLPLIAAGMWNWLGWFGIAIVAVFVLILIAAAVDGVKRSRRAAEAEAARVEYWRNQR